MQSSTKGFELIISDCDGVLVDTEPIINRAHAQVLTACGYSIREEALIERFCGMSDAERAISSSRSGPFTAGLLRCARRRDGRKWVRQSLAPMDGVAELLASLSGIDSRPVAALVDLRVQNCALSSPVSPSNGSQKPQNPKAHVLPSWARTRWKTRRSSRRKA
jgi:beta-phosphoglucomutase-like phosphatase (HAD superfamily)